MSINKFSTHRPLIFCCASLVVAFFDFHIIFRFEVSLWWQWRSWTIRKAESSVCTRKIPEASDSCKSALSAVIKSPDQPPPARGTQPRKNPFSFVFPNWCTPDLSFAVIGIYSTNGPTGIGSPSIFWPYLFSTAGLSWAIVSCTLHKVAKAFHRTVPPFFC